VTATIAASPLVPLIQAGQAWPERGVHLTTSVHTGRVRQDTRRRPGRHPEPALYAVRGIGRWDNLFRHGATRPGLPDMPMGQDVRHKA
jgi:hypothetical protein